MTDKDKTLTAKALNTEITAITNVYANKLRSVVLNAHREIVMPFCQRKKLNFRACDETMSYEFHYAGARHKPDLYFGTRLPPNDIPLYVRKALDIANPLWGEQKIGGMMPTYAYKAQVGDKAIVTEEQWLSMKQRVRSGGVKALSEQYIEHLHLYIGKVGKITHVFPGAVTLRYTKDTAFHVQVTDYTIY
jgi:hypothetical protein